MTDVIDLTESFDGYEWWATRSSQSASLYVFLRFQTMKEALKTLASLNEVNGKYYSWHLYLASSLDIDSFGMRVVCGWARLGKGPTI